jgi:hypothetical protein
VHLQVLETFLSFVKPKLIILWYLLQSTFKKPDIMVLNIIITYEKNNLHRRV